MMTAHHSVGHLLLTMKIMKVYSLFCKNLYYCFFVLHLAFFSQLSDSSLSDDAENIRNMSKSHVDDIFEVGIIL